MLEPEQHHRPPEKVAGLTITPEPCQARATPVGPLTGYTAPPEADHRDACVREAETSPETTAEFCRRTGISEPTLSRWRQKYGGLEVDDAKRLKALEIENSRLKKPLAEVTA